MFMYECKSLTTKRSIFIAPSNVISPSFKMLNCQCASVFTLGFNTYQPEMGVISLPCLKSCFTYKALQQCSETKHIPTAIFKSFQLLETMPKQQGSGFLVAEDCGRRELKSPWEATHEQRNLLITQSFQLLSHHIGWWVLVFLVHAL